MTTIRSIVAATDFSSGSNAALERALQLALAHKASLCLLHACDAGAWSRVKSMFAPGSLSAAAPPSASLLQERLNALGQELSERAGCAVPVHLSLAPAHEAIKDRVAAQGASLVVLGSRAEPALIGLGSTASKVAHAGVAPVLIVRSASAQPYTKVLTALDMRDGAAHTAAAALGLFPAAHHYWLHALDGALAKIHGFGGMPKEGLRVLQDALESHLKQQMEQLAQSLQAQAAHPIDTEVVDDVAARAVVAIAAELAVDCVAIGHHSERSLGQRLLGSMTQHVLHQTRCDVLVIP
ncbi:universal stress protein [Hydrogenophaga sp.]|uniref:universal stress protein n=1 Tax=Hydrogenophaga sp. TaxID=1904254 RepID=UPI0025BBD8AF|nr:universal stress protein [Hydrogenophaga sp.]